MGSMHNLVIILKMFNGVDMLVEASAVSDSVETGQCQILSGQARCQVLLRRGQC